MWVTLKPTSKRRGCSEITLCHLKTQSSLRTLSWTYQRWCPPSVGQRDLTIESLLQTWKQTSRCAWITRYMYIHAQYCTSHIIYIFFTVYRLASRGSRLIQHSRKLPFHSRTMGRNMSYHMVNQSYIKNYVWSVHLHCTCTCMYMWTYLIDLQIYSWILNCTLYNILGC